ncbi:unnamed protein product [Diplocarpon coronariae]|nr:peptidase family M28 [Diplocarpon mali]
MHFIQHLGALGALCAVLVSARPPMPVGDKNTKNLRLVKTGPYHEGMWIEEEDKYTRMDLATYGFIDITDIEDRAVLASLRGFQEPVRKHKYPRSMNFVYVTNNLINNVQMQFPKGYLKDLTDLQNRYYDGSSGSIATAYLMVIAGANYDSVGRTKDGAAPGADSNASGVVTILEALRVIANSRLEPFNTLEFHFYSGKEGGLRGSADIFKKYKAEKQVVLGFLNVAMTGYAPAKGPFIYLSDTDSHLNGFLSRVVYEYTDIQAQYATCYNMYGCSDHISATSNGFPAAFVSGSSNPWTKLRNSPEDVSSQLS